MDKRQYFGHNDRGQRTRTWGQTTYPVEYGYDALGRKTAMKTYRDPAGSYAWTGASWPDPDDADADITQWMHDPSSGRLTRKTYADATHVDYTYTADGRLETRTWARPDGATPLVTTYDYYDDGGEALTRELQSVTYSDTATPGITYAYDRLGRQKAITDVVGTRTFAYDAAMQLETETIDAGANGLYSRTITHDYENGTGETVTGRYAGFHIGSEYNVDYVYEPKMTGTGRLKRINGPGLPDTDGGAFYDYTANSDLVGTLTYKNTAGTAAASATRVYDPDRDLLASIENRKESPTSVTVSKYTYVSDAVGRRTSVVNEGTAFSYASPGRFNVWDYNDRSELIESRRGEGITVQNPPTTEVTAEQRTYAYDPIGNRTESSIGGGAALHYCANAVNQYDATAVAAGCDPATETFDYDADGNLTADGTMTYVWNAENRLIEARPTTPATNDKKVEFKYDYVGRRVEKKVSIYTDGQWVENSDLTQRFVYGGPALDTPGTGTSQGWNVVLVLDGSGSAQQKCTWGLDLSGTMQGAGGIGGLLAAVETQGTTSTADDDAYWYLYDGNGNVGQLLNVGDQTLAVHYEYDPYGNVIVASDVDSSGYVNVNPFRFSTKWFDTEIGAYYYLFRYYAARLGRWLNRDPMGEADGPNEYRFANNRSTSAVDFLGLEAAPASVTVAGTAIYTPSGCGPGYRSLRTSGSIGRYSLLSGPGLGQDGDVPIIRKRREMDYEWEICYKCKCGAIAEVQGPRLLRQNVRNDWDEPGLSAIVVGASVQNWVDLQVTQFGDEECGNGWEGTRRTVRVVACWMETWKVGIRVGIGPIGFSTPLMFTRIAQPFGSTCDTREMTVHCCNSSAMQ